MGKFTAGTSTAVANSITIGHNGVNGNVTIDSNKLPPGNLVGVAGQAGSAATFFGFGVIGNAGTNTVQITQQTSTVGIVTGSQNGSALTSNNVVEINFTVPITGWSSNVQVSSDTDTRIVDFYGTTTAATAFTGTTLTIGYTASTDTHAGYDGTSTYTIRVSGFYRIFAEAPIFQNTAGGGNCTQSIFINGSSAKNTYLTMPTQNAGAVITTSYEAFLAAGTTVQVRISNSFGAMQLTGTAAGTTATLSITRNAGPSVIAASETVAASYAKSGTQAITSASGDNQVTGWTVNNDSHNAFSSNAYVIPVSGRYRIQLCLQSTPATVATQVLGYKINAGSTVYISASSVASGVDRFYGADEFAATAGQSVTLIMNNSTGAATIQSGNANSRFTISRIGN
jgi:hypothetical protein